MAALKSVLYVIDNLEYGGGERGFAQLVRGLAAEGWTVTVAARPGGPFEAAVRAEGTPFVALDMRRSHAVFTALRLRRLVRDGSIGIVHSQGARADFVTRVALLGLRDVASVCTVQMPVEGFDVGPARRRLYLALDRLSGRRVDRYIVVSRALERTLLEARGLAPERVALVYNGVETAALAAAAGGDTRRAFRAELGIDDAQLLVGAVGRLVWQKGFVDLIRAWPDVAARVPAARLVIAGEGPLRAELDATARSLGVADRVRLIGFRRDVPGFLAALDVLVLPSLREGFPVIILEAMALGVAIVATAIEGVREQIQPEVHGLLVPPGQPRELGAAVGGLLEEPARRRRLGEAARQRAAAVFDVGRMVAETQTVYAALLSAAAGVRPVAR